MTELSHSELGGFIADRVEIGVFAVDADFKLTLWNRFMATHSRHSAVDVLGQNLFDVFPELPRAWLERKVRQVQALRNYAFTSWTQRPYLFRFDHNRPITGGVDAMRQNCTFLPVKNAAGEVIQVCVTVQDVTDTAIAHEELAASMAEVEREKAEQRKLIGELAQAQNQVLQSEKLASIGQLAAGVAHEINNPIGFVNSNLGTLASYVDELMVVLDAYTGAHDQLPEDLKAAIDAKIKGVDLDYLREDLVSLVTESRDGLDRVKDIVQDLKDFSRMGESEAAWADLHHCLDTTLNVVANEIKYKAEVVKHYGELPEVECVASQLNQVFMNLMVNGAQAIAERGTITITTGTEGEQVFVAVRDTGAGIPPDVLKRIFDPFYTTKPVGTGTGLGLSVSYSIIERHGGRIVVDSKPGEGTEFKIWLPIRYPAAASAAA
ncbi:MAG TPA: ATP-binding protein [Denitromonas sp.]|uniref:ATP-binding protein n=1 Tax=Denitromonas sp. TaxID=2734609 RepID=UPI002D0F9932|nr:PAS domain-containing protein [Zoogloeaceae bacterium]HPR05735.1 ATP-binding protein [Denitromonas sp.]HQU88857.1 ATP-binding protein [Denitromonas sp.]HQV14861.1 ATP-binding protein [Denitromonas sp.]